HARPAALFVQLASKYKSKVRVAKNDQKVDGKSIMGLMTLAAEYGSNVQVIIDGEDEQELMNEIAKLFENKFNED
ncbi:MAG: HPr family phosphocarrier protein, partial [Elusimicrobiota bacterium]|nr:HPr family phosphocarrier protein [Elusimicrobiota bacterium]